MTFYYKNMSITCLVFVHLSFLFTTLSIYLVIKYMFSKYRPVKETKESLALARGQRQCKYCVYTIC